MGSRRDQIKHVAAKLFIERGVAGTSVRDIADGVGMLSGSLYHHFPSKNAIAFAILYDFLEELNQRYLSVLPHVSGMREEFRALIHSSLQVAAAHPYATEIYQNERSFHGDDSPPEIATAVHTAHGFWIATATAAHEAGQLRPELEPEEVARLIREGVWWSVRYHRDHLVERCDEITATVLSTFVDGASAQSVPEITHVDTAIESLTSRLDGIDQKLDALLERRDSSSEGNH